MSNAAKAAAPTGKSVDRSSGRSGADQRINGSTVPPAAATTPGLIRADGRDPAVVAFEEAVIAFFLESAVLLGIPKSIAAIYGLCFASPDPLGFSEINARLNLSAGSISQGVRVLKEVGALKVAETRGGENADKLTTEKLTSIPVAGAAPAGSSISAFQRVSVSASPISASQRVSVSAFLRRRANAARAPRYTPDLELRRLVLHWIEKRLQKQLTSGRSRLEALVNSIPADDTGGEEVLTERLGILRNWHAKAAGMVPVAKGFLKLT